MQQIMQLVLAGVRTVFRSMRALNQLRRDWYWSLNRWQRTLARIGASSAFIFVLLPSLGWVAGFTYAPSGWQNANMPSRTGLLTISSLEDVAVSTGVPGLMMGCVQSTTFAQSSGAIWRSRDYGQHWEMLSTPFHMDANALCQIASPIGDDHAFFVFISEFHNAAGSYPLWVSHDQGNTWQQVGNKLISWGDFDFLAGSVFRNSHFYTLNDITDAFHAFQSSDDGLTWQTVEAQPSRFEAQGWLPISMAPDYQFAHGWYRIMNNARYSPSLPPMLEHSVDDGQHWLTVGNLGNSPMRFPILATSPAQPQRICASNSLFFFSEAKNADPLSVLASNNAGLTWHVANSIPHVPASLNGDTLQSNANMAITMGADGSCYQLRDYAWNKGTEPSADISSDTQVLQFDPHAPHLTIKTDLPGTFTN